MWIPVIVVVVLIILSIIVKTNSTNSSQRMESNSIDDSTSEWLKELAKEAKERPEINECDRDYYMRQINKYDLKEKTITDTDESLTPVHDSSRLSDEIKKDLIEDVLAYEEPISESDARHSYSIELPYDENSFEEWKKSHPTFQQLLLKYIEEKGISNVEFYNAAWIDRKLFSAIKNNELYKPKKETAVACCLGLELTSAEATRLLKAAGYALSDSIVWDRVIEHCIENKIYKIDQVNEILFELDEKCIGE